MNRDRQSGFSLLEVMIAMFILGMILYLTFSILMSSTEVSERNALSGELEEKGKTFIEKLKEEIQFGRIQTIGADHSWIRFQKQVDHDADGDATDDAGNVEWGWDGPGGPMLGWYADYRFHPRAVFVEQAGVGGLGYPPNVAETRRSIDLNGDGDMNDTFVRGEVRIEIYDQGGNFQEDSAFSSDQVVLAPIPGALGGPALEGDIDNQNGNDLLFQVLDQNQNDVPPGMISAQGVWFRINVWHGAFDNTGKNFLIRQNNERSRLRNQ